MSHWATVLGAKLSLWDCDDVEALCERAAASYQRRFGCRLTPHELEDMIAYLIAATWLLSERYDPARGSFENYANSVIPKRAVDWSRLTHNRSRWQYAHTTVERDTTQLHLEYVSGDGETLGESLPSPHGDPAEHGDPDFLAGILRAPSSSEAWDEAGDRPAVQGRAT